MVAVRGCPGAARSTDAPPVTVGPMIGAARSSLVVGYRPSMRLAGDERPHHGHAEILELLPPQRGRIGQQRGALLEQVAQVAVARPPLGGEQLVHHQLDRGLPGPVEHHVDHQVGVELAAAQAGRDLGGDVGHRDRARRALGRTTRRVRIDQVDVAADPELVLGLVEQVAVDERLRAHVDRQLGIGDAQLVEGDTRALLGAVAAAPEVGRRPRHVGRHPITGLETPPRPARTPRPGPAGSARARGTRAGPGSSAGPVVRGTPTQVSVGAVSRHDRSDSSRARVASRSASGPVAARSSAASRQPSRSPTSHRRSPIPTAAAGSAAMPRRASPRARVSAASTHSSCPVPAQVPSSVRNSGPTLPGSRYASEMLRYAATAHARWSPPAQARSSTCITAVVSVVLVPAWTRKQATALPSLQAAMRPAPSTARRRLLSASLPAREGQVAHEQARLDATALAAAALGQLGRLRRARRWRCPGAGRGGGGALARGPGGDRAAAGVAIGAGRQALAVGLGHHLAQPAGVALDLEQPAGLEQLAERAARR
jgi:hypothetical protein